MSATYQVTVTPKMTTYSSGGVHGQYTVEIYAKDSKEAISKARRQRSDEEGRFGVGATFKASKIEE